ncbi:MAG: NAD(P)-binding domain-containing protein, partial [Nocardioidaceae bacterium]
TYFEDTGLVAQDHHPVPIGVFLDHTEWFRRVKGLEVRERLVTSLTSTDNTFEATLDDGSTVRAERVIAAPGIASFAHLPGWAEQVPADRRAHTVDLVAFDELADARVAVVGGRQSAYEWAALLCDHGAERVDVVHRHATPMFARVSWTFVDRHIEQTLAHRGWWRRLPAEEQEAIAAKFWQVGRLTLEPWLVPRLSTHVVISHPGCEVTDVAAGEDYATLRLSDGQTCSADFVVFASGYKADLGRVPYLGPVLPEVSATNGFPDLSEGFETSLPGLYMTGFVSTRDFGPFFGFTKGCPASAHIAVTEMQR